MESFMVSEPIIKVVTDRKESEDVGANSSSATTTSSVPETRSLYERLGGTAAVRQVVHDFYNRCLEDPMLTRFFDESKLAALKYHQVEFLKVAFTRIPDDFDVAEHLTAKHRSLFADGLDESHFDKVCVHLVASLEAAGVSADMILEAAEILGSLRPIFVQGAAKYGGMESSFSTNGTSNVDEDADADAKRRRSLLLNDTPHVVLTTPSTDNKSLTTASTSNTGHQIPKATLAERLGGVDALKATVSILYSRLVEDVDLAPFFQDINMTFLKLHQVEFLKIAFGQIPDGLDVIKLMMTKHKRLFEEKGLNELHFDKVANHLVAALEELQVPKELIDEAAGVVSSLRVAFEQGAALAKEQPQLT